MTCTLAVLRRCSSASTVKQVSTTVLSFAHNWNASTVTTGAKGSADRECDVPGRVRPGSAVAVREVDVGRGPTTAGLGGGGAAVSCLGGFLRFIGPRGIP